MPVWTGLGVDNNWSTVLNWGIDGSGNTGVPIATTSAFFTGVAPNGNKPCTITSGATCLNLDFTGYTAGVSPNTAIITFSNQLIVKGSITLSASMGNFAGTAGITATFAVPVTFTSNNKAFNLPLTISNNAGTITFVNTWTVTNFVTLSVSGNNQIYTGGTVNITGNLTGNQPTGVSTTQFILTGTGTFSTTANWSPPTEINSTGVITLGSVVLANGCVFSYNALSLNNIVSSPGNISISSVGQTATLDLKNQAVGSFSMIGNCTLTLLSNANVLNATLGANNNTGVTLNGAGFRLNVRGNFRVGQETGLLAGTGTVALTGSGTISCALSNAVNNNSAIGVDLELNTSSVYTATSNVSFYNKTFTRLNGTINWATFTLFLTGNTTFNTAGITFNNITNVNSGAIITITSTLTVSGILTFLSTVIFTGTAGWVTNNFTYPLSGTCTLQAGNTYTVNGLFTMIGTSLSRATLQSNDFANVTVSIPASPSLLMTVTVGTIPTPVAGYVLGSVAFSTALPTVLSNLLPDRPTIASGSASPYTLTAPIGVTALTSYVGQVGKKAFFIVTNGTGSTNVVYAQTRDIDSGNGGITIFAGQSFADNTTTPNLFRTLNWGPLIAPSGSVYYTFVN